MKTQRPLRGIRKQRGLVVVIVTIALLLLIAVAAFHPGFMADAGLPLVTAGR